MLVSRHVSVWNSLNKMCKVGLCDVIFVHINAACTERMCVLYLLTAYLHIYQLHAAQRLSESQV